MNNKFDKSELNIILIWIPKERHYAETWTENADDIYKKNTDDTLIMISKKNTSDIFKKTRMISKKTLMISKKNTNDI